MPCPPGAGVENKQAQNSTESPTASFFSLRAHFTRSLIARATRARCMTTGEKQCDRSRIAFCQLFLDLMLDVVKNVLTYTIGGGGLAPWHIRMIQQLIQQDKPRL